MSTSKSLTQLIPSTSISQKLSSKELHAKADSLLKQKWKCCSMTKITDSQLKEAFDHYILASEKYQNESNYIQAIGCYKKALPITRKLKERGLEANINFQLAIILVNNLNECDEGFIYLQNFRLAYLNIGINIDIDIKEYIGRLMVMIEKLKECSNTNLNNLQLCNKYIEECYNFILNDAILNNFKLFTNKDQEQIPTIFLEIQKYYISKEKYSHLLPKVDQISQKYKTNATSEIYKKESVILDGLVILLNFIINSNNKNNTTETQNIALNVTETKNEALFTNIRNLIHYILNNKKVEFLVSVTFKAIF